MTTENKLSYNFNFQKLFLIFVIGSIAGTLYEQILELIKVFLKSGNIVWVLRKGVIYGPFNPLYGAGFVLLAFLLGRKKRPWYLNLLYGSLLGGGLEFLISILQEWVIGTRSWNYSNQFLNIDGRTTIPIMFFWGILTTIFIEIILPYLSNLIENIPPAVENPIVYFLLIFLIIDMLISWTALFRQKQRQEGHEPLTPIGEIYDKYYTDAFLRKNFPNMKFSKPKEYNV